MIPTGTSTSLLVRSTCSVVSAALLYGPGSGFSHWCGPESRSCLLTNFHTAYGIRIFVMKTSKKYFGTNFPGICIPGESGSLIMRLIRIRVIRFFWFCRKGFCPIWIQAEYFKIKLNLDIKIFLLQPRATCVRRTTPSPPPTGWPRKVSQAASSPPSPPPPQHCRGVQERLRQPRPALLCLLGAHSGAQAQVLREGVDPVGQVRLRY